MTTKRAADEATEIAEAHTNARNVIAWLSVPGVALRYNLEADYIIGLLKMCMESCTKWEAVEDINMLIGYVKTTVGA